MSGMRITYDLPRAESVSLRIFDVAGRCVRHLTEAPKSAGRHTVVWMGKDDEGRPLSAGVYFVSFAAADYEDMRKVILID
jgi:flagellar hook assembly protein FlgD